MKKALLGAEHFRVSIEKVEAKQASLKGSIGNFLQRISQSLSFGHVRVSDDLNNMDSRKLFARDFRSEKQAREQMGLKDRMMIVDQERFYFYQQADAKDPSRSIPFLDIKEVIMIKEEGEQNF